MADKDDVLTVATQRLKRSIESRSQSRKYQLADLKFLSGNSDNKYQWEETALRSRKGNNVDDERPTLTINSLPHHQHQITNEQRQNRPSGKVLPVDDQADPKTAEIITGLIRHVEVSSDIAVALDNACFHQTAHGEGYYRLLAEYVDPKSFNQELRFKQVRNPFSVYDDPDIQHPVGIDRKWCFIVDELTEEEHEAQFPGKQVISLQESGVGDQAIWRCEGNKVRVAEYYRIEDDTKTLCAWSDGSVTVKEDEEEGMEAAYTQRGITRVLKNGKPLERKTEIPVIKWFKTNGKEILEAETIIPGSFIPLFRVVGNEYVIDGRVEVSGIVRNAKDPCRMVNFWWSQEAEWLARSPIIPWIGYEGQFTDPKWRQANRVGYPFLEAKPIVDEATGTVLPLPQRVAPPAPPSGLIEAKLQAIDAMKQTTGFYDASLGARSNETSGRAIVARERQGDIGSYHFVDNLKCAVEWHSRYIVDVLPVYLDTAQVVRIIGEDGTPDHASVDPEMAEGYREQETETGDIKRIFNPGVGKYDVVATAGPSYMTRRVEAAEGMQAFIQASPGLMNVVGDLLVKNLDWPGADELAKRLKKMVPPQALADDKQVDPAKMEQAMQMVDQLTQQLHEMHDGREALEQQVKIYEAKTKRLQILVDKIPPDFMPEIVITSDLLDADDFSAVGNRGMAPPMEQPAPQPMQQPQGPPETLQ